MKCPKCNYESNQQFEFCPYCGAEASALSVSLNPAADKILKALLDPLFLLICIFITVSCAVTVLSGSGMPLLNILFSIFLWITYSSAKKGFADEKQLKSISGTVYANYVIANVCAVLMFIVGILFSFALTIMSKEEGYIDSLITEASAQLTQEGVDLLTIIFGVSGWIFFAIFTIIAILTIVINVVFMKRIHLFAKSVYKSVENGVLELHNPKFARTALFIFGGLSLFSALSEFSNVFSLISTVCIGLAEIFSGILIGKYCLETQNEGEIYYESN